MYIGGGKEMAMIVDTHAHIYHRDEERYPMKKETFRPVPGVGTIEQLRRAAAPSVASRRLVALGQ